MRWAAGDDVRRDFLAALPGRLASVLGGDELRDTLGEPVPGSRIRSAPGSVRVGDRVLPSTLPVVSIELDPPVDVRWLAEAWGITAPVGVSGDVHQQRWHLRTAGDELPDPHNRRIASHTPVAGRWQLDALLAGRPVGPLPTTVSGASPAYDLLVTGAEVAEVVVSRADFDAELVRRDDPRRMSLATGSRGDRSDDRNAAAAEHVLVSRSGAPLAGARFRSERRALVVDEIAVVREGSALHAGSALLDTLEALTLDRQLASVRLGAAATIDGIVPYERHGYRQAARTGLGLGVGRGVERVVHRAV